MVGMKIAVIGASGLIGTKARRSLTADGHEVVAASRNTGVDVLTGEGLADALAGADVLVDVVNSPDLLGRPGDGRSSPRPTTNLVGSGEEGRRRSLRRAVDRRRRRTARQRIHACQGRPGEDHHRIGSAVHDRAGHAVRRVHRRNHRLDDRRRRGARPRRVDPADRRRPGGLRASRAPPSPRRSTTS